MSDIVSLSAARKTAGVKMRIGLLRLADGAPIIAAHEFGFFSEEGLDAELVVEPSWANIADKLAFGFLDAAVIVPPLAFAVHLGVRGAAPSIIVPYAVSAGGSTVTLGRALAEKTQDLENAKGLSRVEALAACLREQSATFGVVHAYSTHNLLLRYWLGTAGIEADRGEVKLAVVPPARAVEALAADEIAGFCAGAPWGEVARRAGVGVNVATSHDIWQNAPEKVLALRASWAEENPKALGGAIRALLRAAKFCDDAQNASYVAALLSRRKYLDLDSHAILASMPGGPPHDKGCVFFRGATTFPWRSQGLWFLNQMRRWGLVDPRVDLFKLTECVYRPDLYRAALAPSGDAAPVADWKDEGAHNEAWTLEATPLPIPMAADRFCDGRIFPPVAALSATTRESALHNL